MKFMYPAVFRKNEDGTYNGYFPDLECCTSTGDTLDEAIENANEAAYNWITVELDEEEPNLPSISDPSDLDLTPEDIVRIISVNIRFYEGWDEQHPKHYAAILKILKPTGIVSHITQIRYTCRLFVSSLFTFIIHQHILIILSNHQFSCFITNISQLLHHFSSPLADTVMRPLLRIPQQCNVPNRVYYLCVGI